MSFCSHAGNTSIISETNIPDFLGLVTSLEPSPPKSCTNCPPARYIICVEQSATGRGCPRSRVVSAVRITSRMFYTFYLSTTDSIMLVTDTVVTWTSPLSSHSPNLFRINCNMELLIITLFYSSFPTEVSIDSAVIWDVALCSWLEKH